MYTFLKKSIPPDLCVYSPRATIPRIGESSGREERIILLFLTRVAQLTRFGTLGDNAPMETPAETDLPDRRCTWCGIPMKKRLVGGKQFVHYTCPKCIFQHTIKLPPKLVAPKG